MTVKSILDLKGRNVISITPEKSLSDAAELLAEHHIGAVVVLDADNALHGILSERDIVRAIATEHEQGLSRPISAFMTSHVTVCTESATVTEVMRMMTMGRFRHLPVARDGKIVGLVSIGDVVKRRIEEAEREAEEIRSYIATA